MGRDDSRLVEFICLPEKKGDIPQPEASSDVLPEWYKRLEMISKKIDSVFGERTVRQCPAFLDGLSLGWMLMTETEVRVNTANPDEGDVEVHDDGEGFAEVVELGNGKTPDGVVGSVEFHTNWAAKVPDGYSILVLPPLNRREQRYTVVPQMIDADKNLSLIDVPVLWRADKAKTIITEGSPLAQVIPIKRDSRIEEAITRPFRNDGKQSFERTKRKSKHNHSWYRLNCWEPKGTRMVSSDEL